MLVAASLGLSACVAERLAPGPGPTASRFADKGHWISSDGFALAYSSWEAPAPKQVIVALHGMNNYAQVFEDAATYWQKQGITTYAFDQRGFGRTEGNGRWPGHEVMAEDARQFLSLVRAKHPDAKIFLLGESMGGAVATLAASGLGSEKIDGLILVSPAFWGWSNLDVLKRSALWVMMQVAPGGRLSGRGLNIKPSDNEKMLIAMGQDPYVIKSTRVDATYGLVNLMEAAWNAAPHVTLPTLALYAKGDEVVPSKPIELAIDSLKGPTQVVCFDDGFHMLLRDLNADRTWKRVAEFVAQATPSNSSKTGCGS